MLTAWPSRLWPWTAAQAVERALSCVGEGLYGLGTGGRDPRASRPWTRRGGVASSDCVGLVMWAWAMDRYQPRFPRWGGWCNTDSMIADARGGARWFRAVTRGEAVPGDLLVYGSARDATGKRTRIGHVGMLVDVGTVVHCSGARGPAVKRDSDALWSRARGWLSWTLRVMPPPEGV